MHVINQKAHANHAYLIFGVIGLFALLCFLLASYAFLVNKTVLNVVAREKAEDQISSLTSQVGDLQFKEMSMKNTITLDLAYSLGFSDATKVTFVSRNPATKSLTISR